MNSDTKLRQRPGPRAPVIHYTPGAEPGGLFTVGVFQDVGGDQGTRRAETGGFLGILPSAKDTPGGSLSGSARREGRSVDLASSANRARVARCSNCSRGRPRHSTAAGTRRTRRGSAFSRKTDASSRPGRPRRVLVRVAATRAADAWVSITTARQADLGLVGPVTIADHFENRVAFPIPKGKPAASTPQRLTIRRGTEAPLQLHALRK